MTKSYLVYRALFPPLYSVRTGSDYLTLRLPQIRLFGPMWSFGMSVREANEVDRLPGMGSADKGAASTALRALYQMQSPGKLGKMRKFHTPVFLRAEVDSFLQPIFQELHESRMSLLALDTIRPSSIDGDQLRKVSRFDLPVVKNQQPVIDGADNPSICASASIIASPFGDVPDPDVDTDASDRGQYLAAMQLMHGAIRFKPDPYYLKSVRKQMGLGTPVGDQRLDTIVLLPDGFCVAGTVQLPWLASDSAVTGWFKATLREKKGGSMEADGAAAGVQRVLKLWFDPADRAHAELLDQWRGHLVQLDSLLRAAHGKLGQPRWLDFSPSTELTPEHLFWPERGAADVPLFSRLNAGSRVSIDSAALDLRLADPARATDSTAIMTIKPESFEFDRQGSLCIISGQAGAPGQAQTSADAVSASYCFDAGRGAASDSEASERLSLMVGGDRTRPVTLAVPLIETADLIRNATGLPRPAPDAAMLDLLWTFSPLDDGWLHWPMPNATESALARLAPDPAPVGDIGAPSADDGISGAFAFCNLPGHHGFRADERSWSFSVAGAGAAAIELTLDIGTPSFGKVHHAAVTLSQVVLAFQGFATVTPFRQTPQRLLPDHAERALTSLALLAVSPSSLCGVEADLWHQSRDDQRLKLRFEVSLHDFAIKAETCGSARIAANAAVSWITTMGGSDLAHCARAMQPWLWKAHPVLPTIQALPRALAGQARNSPSGGRSLAPLRLREAPACGALVYRAPVEMGAAGLAIEVGYPEGGQSAAFEHPNTGALWRDEIGMAVTTMASMTLFAGADQFSDPPGAIELGTDWAGLPARVAAELRHDIALRDEHNAFARAPGPAPSDPDAARIPDPAPADPDAEPIRKPEPPLPPDPEFSPLAGNGPHGVALELKPQCVALEPKPEFSPLAGNGPHGVALEPKPQCVALEPKLGTSNGWDNVWRFLNRRTALAALDRRALLVKDTQGYALTGVFGHTDFYLAKNGVAVNSGTVIARAEVLGAIDKIANIGSVKLTFADAHDTPGQLDLRGLPATSDLSGINGIFTRGNQSIEVVAGTADIAWEIGVGFTDQFGLCLLGANDTGALTIKHLSDGPNGGRAAMLVSLNQPLQLDLETHLEFHCTDVPLGSDGSDSLLSKFGSGADLAERSNSAGLTSNHLAGFRWSLYGLDTQQDSVVVVQGLRFEPLELCGMTLRLNAQIATLRIRGRLLLGVHSPGTTSAQQQSDGLAFLDVACLSDGTCKLALTLESTGGIWPLVEPTTFPGVAPTLELKQLPPIGGAVTALLRYRFGDDDSLVKIALTRHADGRFTGQLLADAKEDTTKDTGVGLDFSTLSVTLRGAACAEAHSLTIEYRLRLGAPGARVTGRCVHYLLDGSTSINELEYAFSAAAGEQLPLVAASRANGEPEVSFDPRLIALCWRSAEGAACRVLGGLAALSGSGSLMATLAPTSGAVASYSCGQIDARARFDLRAASAGAEQALTLKLDSADGVSTYSLAGQLKVENAFSWPEVTVHEAQAWQTAAFVASPERSFSHQALLRFDGQRLSPAALAGAEDVELMVDVENSVHLSGDRTPLTWEAFQVVRLLPMARFRAALQVAALPAPPPSRRDLQKGDTAYSPLVAKQARPLIGFEAARHILHNGAANAGGLSGALAGQLFDHLNKADTPGLAVDLSNHVMLAFGADLATADKLQAPLVLTSMAGIAFVTPQLGVEVLPADIIHPLRRALACRADVDRTLYLDASDALRAHRFPPLDARLARSAELRLQRAFASRRPGLDLATQIASANGGRDRRVHQPVFQAVVFREEAGQKAPLAYDAYPAAATAFHLSELFATEQDKMPLAIGFGGAGRIEMDDMLGPSDGMTDLRAASAVYRRALDTFRNWAARNVIPGPGLLPPRISDKRVPVMQVDAMTRDGASIATLAKLALGKVDGDPLEQARRWAKRALQRGAPWATEGMLTVRCAAFGLDGGAQTTLVRVDLLDFVRPDRSEPLQAAPLPPQPQREARAAMSQPLPGVQAGYLPIRVKPAVFLSDQPGSVTEPRLAANGVTVTWTLDCGSAAILEAGPGDQGKAFDDLWICDRERVAVRPSKPVPTALHKREATPAPYELTFALPNGYHAAMPRAMQPTAYPVRLAPQQREGVFEQSCAQARLLPQQCERVFHQSYAPGRLSTSRIAARAGAWTSSRTGLAQMPSKQDLHASRASETPVHLRQPRPASLALNDRTRPSSHEPDRHVDVSAMQNCIVHGPRAMRAGGDLERVGLNRSPRSLFATPLTLQSPAGSIITPDWSGSIVIATGRWLGKFVDSLQWKVASASLIHQGDRYVASLVNVPAIDPEGVTLRFERFERSNGETIVSARDALTTLASLSEVIFELNLDYSNTSGDSVILHRQVRFHLYAGTPHGVGVEAPLFFRFEDPEFNDRLGGLAKLRRVTSVTSPTDDFILAADVAQLRPSQRIELALAIRAKEASSTSKPFGVTEGKLTYGDKFVHLLMKRLRRQETDSQLRACGDAAVSNTQGDDGGDGGLFLKAPPYAGEVLFHAMAIDCGDLKGAGPESAAALRPGDQLQLTLMAYNTKKPTEADTTLVSLLLDVVAQPYLPANPAGFAILLLRGHTIAKTNSASVGVHMYANGPEASQIEIVDPRDMIEGLVRRRAVYYWRSFYDLGHGPAHYFALQKINAVGGSWLPDQLESGWQAVSHCVPASSDAISF
jgi:hypothetical protein